MKDVDFNSQATAADVRAARRRLLRGTFGAPAVMALSSGSALAATSASLCFRSAPSADDPAHSTYARFRVQRYSATLSGASIKVVKGSDVKGRAVVEGFSEGIYTGTTSSETYFNVATGLKVEASSLTNITPDTGLFVALRFENLNYGSSSPPSFKVTGLAQSATIYSGSSAGKLMTGSCWGSFAV